MVQRSALTSIPITGPSLTITIILKFTPSFIIQSTTSILPSENPSRPSLLLYKHILALTDVSIASLLPQATCIWQWHQHSFSHLKMKYWISFDVFLPFYPPPPYIMWGQVTFPFFLCLELPATFSESKSNAWSSNMNIL